MKIQNKIIFDKCIYLKILKNNFKNELRFNYKINEINKKILLKTCESLSTN